MMAALCAAAATVDGMILYARSMLRLNKNRQCICETYRNTARCKVSRFRNLGSS